MPVDTVHPSRIILFLPSEDGMPRAGVLLSRFLLPSGGSCLVDFDSNPHRARPPSGPICTSSSRQRGRADLAEKREHKLTSGPRFLDLIHPVRYYTWWWGIMGMLALMRLMSSQQRERRSRRVLQARDGSVTSISKRDYSLHCQEDDNSLLSGKRLRDSGLHLPEVCWVYCK